MASKVKVKRLSDFMGYHLSSSSREYPWSMEDEVGLLELGSWSLARKARERGLLLDELEREWQLEGIHPWEWAVKFNKADIEKIKRAFERARGDNALKRVRRKYTLNAVVYTPARTYLVTYEVHPFYGDYGVVIADLALKRVRLHGSKRWR